MSNHWLLLRGLAREQEHWGHFYQQMASISSRIDCIDLPGCGVYFHETSPMSIDSIMELTRQRLLEKIGGIPSVNLLAVSLGGMVAWQWRIKYPDEIKRMVLINTSFASLSPFYHRLLPARYFTLGKILLTPTVLDRELAILRLISHLPDIEQRTLANQWASIQQQHPVSYHTLVNQLIAAARFIPSQPLDPSTILLLNSQQDRLVSMRCSEQISDRYRLLLRRHPWAGHDLTLDDGPWVIEQLQNWLHSDFDKF